MSITVIDTPETRTRKAFDAWVTAEIGHWAIGGWIVYKDGGSSWFYKNMVIRKLWDKWKKEVTPWPIKGVRVDGDKVIIACAGGNDAARWLCAKLLEGR